MVEVTAPDGAAAEFFADALNRKLHGRLPALSGFVGTTTAEIARIEHVAGRS